MPTRLPDTAAKKKPVTSMTIAAKKAPGTFVHGMANKPPADVMLKLWLRALERDDPKPEVHLPPNAGLDLGTIGASVDSVYWADVLYGTPETDVSGYERQG